MMQEVTQALGKTLREWRILHHTSQSVVARELMIRQEQVSKFELGREIAERATFDLSKFVQNRCLNAQKIESMTPTAPPVTPLSHPKRSSYEAIIEYLYLHGLDETNREHFIAFLKEIL